MTQTILDGIVTALLEEFPDVKVHQEQVKQGLNAPCFLVRTLKISDTPLLGTRHKRDSLFSVQYIPKSTTDAKAECNGVTDTLFQALEYITVDGDLRRGTSMRGEYFDGVLTFTVQYNAVVRMFPEIDPMETLDIENSAR